MNMKSGVIDAYSSNPVIGMMLRYFEVAKYVNKYSFGGGGFMCVMNWDKWNKVSPADQKLITDTIHEMDEGIQKIQAEFVTLFYQELDKAGGKINTPGPEWDTVAKPQWDKWEADATAAGVQNPDAILNYWKQMRDDFLKK